MSDAITAALKAAQKPVKSYLWTPSDAITFTPAVLERIFGDGRALFSITTINDRPAYWIIRGCSTWMISGDYRAPADAPDFADFTDDILTAIEEEYGTSDYYELNAQHRWIDSETKKFVPTSWAEFPVINTHDGCSWGRLDWPALDGVEIEEHPFANRGNVLKADDTPPAEACATCNGTGKEGRHSICRDCDEPPPPAENVVGGEPRRPQPLDPRGMSINQINAHILDLEAELRRRDGTLAAKGSLSDVEAVGDPNAWLFHSPPQKQYIERGTPNYAEAEAAFTEYFVKNYPGPDTVIYNPNWHAPKIFAAAASAIRAALSASGDD